MFDRLRVSFHRKITDSFPNLTSSQSSICLASGLVFKLIGCNLVGF